MQVVSQLSTVVMSIMMCTEACVRACVCVSHNTNCFQGLPAALSNLRRQHIPLMPPRLLPPSSSRAAAQPGRHQHAWPLCCAAGPPLDNDTFWCPSFLDSCYSFRDTLATFGIAETACKTIGGRLVSWNSGRGQLLDVCTAKLAWDSAYKGRPGQASGQAR